MLLAKFKQKRTKKRAFFGPKSAIFVRPKNNKKGPKSFFYQTSPFTSFIQPNLSKKASKSKSKKGAILTPKKNLAEIYFLSLFHFWNPENAAKNQKNQPGGS